MKRRFCEVPRRTALGRTAELAQTLKTLEKALGSPQRKQRKKRIEPGGHQPQGRGPSWLAGPLAPPRRMLCGQPKVTRIAAMASARAGHALRSGGRRAPTSSTARRVAAPSPACILVIGPSRTPDRVPSRWAGGKGGTLDLRLHHRRRRLGRVGAGEPALRQERNTGAAAGGRTGYAARQGAGGGPRQLSGYRLFRSALSLDRT